MIINNIKKLNLSTLRILIIVCTVAITYTSCTERIDISLGTTYTRLAVEGYITPFEGNQYIRLTETADYFANKAPIPVLGATITVDNGSTIVEFIEDTINQGYYNADDTYVGEPGVEYQLSIELTKEINGKSSFTASETMPFPSEKVDSIALEYNDQWEMWMVKLYALEPPTKDFYMFNGYVNGELITDSVANKNISDDRLYNGNYTSGAIVLTIKEEDLKPGDTVTLSLSNITEEYANFMMELQQEIQPHDPMFSGPPANVSSNIIMEAVGYFAAYPSVFVSTTAIIP